jgi:hypothetical protein
VNKWLLYESEKKKIQAKNLSSEEYEKAILELANRLKV